MLSIPLKALDGSNVIEEHLLEITNLKNFLCERYGQSGNYSHKVREICTNCLNGFENKSALEDHKLLCWNKRAQKEVMPEPGETLSFTNHRKKFKTPIIGALDFEKLISSLTCLGLRDKSGQPLSLSSWTPSSPAIVDQATKATGQLMRLTFSSAAAMACLSGWNSLACK